ncbi:MAG: hypothetical protein OK455_04070 [Thaumarchaeota archaeon]|nr:hypothetical protein [Nitrososphaerota archaeon]
MSTADIAAAFIKQLTAEEWQTLRGLERCELGESTTSAEAIAKISRQPMERVAFALTELGKKRLIGTAGRNYKLYTPAVDLLALKYYADKDYAHALGKLIAKGKESDVFEVLSGKSELFALKLFRLGRTSFRDVTRKRRSDSRQANTWLRSNYQAADREFRALSRLASVTKDVPVAVACDRHTVLLRELPGVRLTNRPELLDVNGVLKEIFGTVRDAYQGAGMINGDLSEYNVLTDGARVWLIDWPQWVSRDHPNAEELLKRDISAITKFFARSYGRVVNPEAVYGYVTGERRFPAIRRG